MVRCEECKSKEKTGEYSDPYETALRSKKGGYPILTGYIMPTTTDCNSCGKTVQVSGWFEKDPYI